MPREDRRYVYDAAWNLNFRTNNTTLNTFKVDSKNQLTNATPVGNQTYDGNGNVITSQGGIQTFSYDDENRLRTNELTGPYSRSVFTYDGLGRLRQREEYAFSGTPTFYWYLTETVRYIYDGMRVIQERNDSNVPTVSYTRGSDLSGSLEGAGGIGGLLARSHAYQTASGNFTNHNYYHADGNGNITYLVNSSQGLAASYKYDAYGNLVSQSGSLAGANVYRFSSKEWLATPGLYYYGYRWYAPTLQRWPSRDPLGEPGFEVLRGRNPNPLGDGPNLYVFVSNNPIGNTDLLGLENNRWNRGRCCNRSKEDQWALVDSGEGCARWRKLAPKECVGGMWTDDDCEGMTCNGGFYKVAGYDLSAYCMFRCDIWPMGGRRWTPDPGDRGGRAKSPTGVGKCADESDSPPGYEYGR